MPSTLTEPRRVVAVELVPPADGAERAYRWRVLAAIAARLRDLGRVTTDAAAARLEVEARELWDALREGPSDGGRGPE